MKLYGGAALALTMALAGCNNFKQSKSESKMEQANVIEVVMFKTKENIKPDDAQKELSKLNDFIVTQKGFISRKTAIADDGQYLDLVFWTDLASAQTASDKAMQNPEIAKIFGVIHQEEMVFKYFHVFNFIETDK